MELTECMEISPRGFGCTRPADHGGKFHVAHTDEVRDGRRVVVDRWLIDGEA
ncbi:hypothetical protein SEA_CHANCELLOR_88 [Mycobacterium phage Chancellor]|uniref:Uncharacterized protein n=1 Tax=Mycobacterium phage Mitti TaxID=1917488 RepID=A0A1J0MDU0_9CAUD|nr:hypothetical protein SEA_MITTI_88 [Mycobacterium phage Mitti]ASW31727.1 hypothetical protein SEA_CHANCELLOR_88 [Mycobacterium phage Chancellor]AVR77399.1 hypothetical protein SEA_SAMSCHEPPERS_87 [Mycobacterium phage SamScheppers]